ncbi:putative nucleic acid-binding Zn finger protein [Methanocalculus alkaliphilus]|uniref:SWIM zinc finger family protein n=1 Tax=Methanocalculus alkaliphilus TaxID=768730 RepID=UPI0020A12081|nr:SWIM zinc finger family protein [Methanocalculus alkaliphilus]MCP1715247.1 putative nucleic acid-binding Zn finger protein [Methanocalculus alkaliphilus]
MINPWVLLQSEKRLTDEGRRGIIHAYQERGEKAILAVEHGNVKKYIDFWVVVGRRDEYIVEDGFCTCEDFLYRGGECWHSIAVRIARCCSLFEEFDLYYKEKGTGEQETIYGDGQKV